MGARVIRHGNLGLALGNLKLSKQVGIFNLPAGSEYTCPCDCPGCFAKKPQVQYPKVLAARIRNWEASKAATFVNDFIALVNKAKVYHVRLHESGDIYSQEYCDKLEAIAKALPWVSFYTYTKTSFKPQAPNINIVESILPDGNINYGSPEFVFAMAKKHGAKICPIARLEHKGKKDHGIVCGEQCKACHYHKYVVFDQH